MTLKDFIALSRTSEDFQGLSRPLEDFGRLQRAILIVLNHLSTFSVPSWEAKIFKFHQVFIGCLRIHFLAKIASQEPSWTELGPTWAPKMAKMGAKMAPKTDPKTIQKMIKILMRFLSPKQPPQKTLLASEREAGLVLSYLALPYLNVLPHLQSSQRLTLSCLISPYLT